MHGDQPDDEFGNARELSHLRIALDSSSLFTQLICATTPGRTCECTQRRFDTLPDFRQPINQVLAAEHISSERLMTHRPENLFVIGMRLELIVGVKDDDLPPGLMPKHQLEPALE